MKLYYKKDNKFVHKHKQLIRWGQEKTGFSDYQLMWAAFGKGFLIGLILL